MEFLGVSLSFLEFNRFSLSFIEIGSLSVSSVTENKNKTRGLRMSET